MRLRIGVNFHSFDTRISGVEYYALGLLRGLLRVEPRNDYVVFTNRPCLIDSQVTSSTSLTIVKADHVGTRAARVLYESTVLPRLARHYGLDVLHCTSYVQPGRMAPVPSVVTVHDTIALDHPDWCKALNAVYFNLMMGHSSRRASRVIAVSHQTATDLKRCLGLPSSTTRVVHSGIDEIFRAAPDPALNHRVRAQYGLPKHYILYVGNIEPKKNVATLLRVHRRLRQRGLPHQLVMAGGRSWRVRRLLRDLAHEARLGHVVMTGYVERRHLPPIYQMADVFVFPSLYEGFGFPPLEAMASGTPVVASGRGALSETLGQAAWTVDPDDPEQIGDAIVRILSDGATRDHYIQAGLRRSRRFNWDRAARATLAVYREAIDDRIPVVQRKPSFQASGQRHPLLVGDSIGFKGTCAYGVRDDI